MRQRSQVALCLTLLKGNPREYDSVDAVRRNVRCCHRPDNLPRLVSTPSSTTDDDDDDDDGAEAESTSSDNPEAASGTP